MKSLQRWALLLTFMCGLTPASSPSLAASNAFGVPPVAAAKFAEIPATKEILKQLRLGGFVLYLRHGNTDNSRPDRMPSVDLKDCSTQRPLTEAGRHEARVVGEAMLQARIPIGEVRSSPLCRAKDTVVAALPGQAFVIDDDLIYTANLTDVQKAPILANTKRLLSTPVAGGKNRLIIAHAPILMDLIGYFPKEVTLVIFRPKGEAGFEYLASIPAAHWPELLR